MESIRRIGVIYRVDEHGFFVGTPAVPELPQNWARAIKEVKASYVKCFGRMLHSLYVCGSLVRGTAIDYISDLDTVVLLDCPAAVINTLDFNWFAELENRIRYESSVISKLELSAFSVDDFLHIPELEEDRFLIKLQSLCIYGDGLADVLPKVKLSHSLAYHLSHSITSELRAAAVKVIHSKTEDEIKLWCRWSAKRILRAGMALVMVAEKAYSRDVYFCYEFFTRYYPETIPQMWQALFWTINPIARRNEIVLLLRFFEEYFKPKIEILHDHAKMNCQTVL